MGGLASSVEEMRRRFQRVTAAKQVLEERRGAQQASVERAELLRFQLEELTSANLQVGEDDTLTAERMRAALQDDENALRKAFGPGAGEFLA